ncbi:XdhC/CoxI family protein [Bacillus sp. JJ1566]|uniref:XdhC family protein n=1 Tax=Bacillus sp. JJ1566 TaxID=3122961 RepID=UPI002FFD6F15
MRNLILGLEKCLAEKKTAVIATIIKTEGSTYQPVGARSLIMVDGQIEGLVSGGCVESDLIERVSGIIENYRPETLYYDFRSEFDLLWGMGLGCDGAVEIFLQPFDPINHLKNAEEIYKSMKQRDETEESYQIATVVQSSNESKCPVGLIQILPSLDEVQLKQSMLCEITINGARTVSFIEKVEPRPHVTIFGAGPDVVPVVQQLANINWKTTIVDHRPQYATSIHFPEANEVILTTRNGYESMKLKKNTYVIIMTHNFEVDVSILRRLSKENVQYIGILGAHRRIFKLLEELKDSEIDMFTANKVHSPIGLDIGAQSPEEIALSIVSELLAVKNNKNASRRVVTTNEYRTLLQRC